MGNKIDKMDASLMQHAPLDDDIISNLYFIHDAFRYMDMVSLACEAIIRPSHAEARGRISSLEDFGIILKSCGKKMGVQSTFSKILIASGNLEILIGKMENVWAYEIENSLVKPIQKCLTDDSTELTIMRNEIMKYRVELRDVKINNGKNVEDLEKKYQVLKEQLRTRLVEQKRTIAEFWKRLTKILTAQLEMSQNSTVHLESLVEILQKNPKKIHLNDEDLNEESFSFREAYKHNNPSPTLIINTENSHTSDLPEFSKITLKNKHSFATFITRKLLYNPFIKTGASSSNA